MYADFERLFESPDEAQRLALSEAFHRHSAHLHQLTLLVSALSERHLGLHARAAATFRELRLATPPDADPEDFVFLDRLIQASDAAALSDHQP